MAEILVGQVLEVENLVSYRGRMSQRQIEEIGRDMEKEIITAGGKRIGYPITATYQNYNAISDVEILVPIDKELSNLKKYKYKPLLRIVNAVKSSHKGNVNGLQQTCIQLNKYIEEKKLQPITVGYNVMRGVNPLNNQEIDMDIYVGINPNSL